MKIGIFDPYLDTLAGGEKYMLSIARCLAKEHDVAIFWDMAKEHQMREKISRKFSYDLSKIKFTPSIFGRNTSFLQRFRKSKAFDYIIILSDGSVPYLSSKTILHFQTPMEWLKVNSLKTKIKMSNVQHIICNSLFTKKYIDKKFNVNSSVVYPPVEINEIKNIEKENIILNVGRYGINHAGSSFKKQDEMVEMFSEMLENEIQNWKLVLVVSTMNEEEEQKLEKLKDKVKELPIRIIENPRNDELWTMYAKSKIYWHAAGFGEDLIRHPDRAEHFGIATVEAMGMGAVPVVINAGGQPEIVMDGKSGYLWETKEQLITKTLKLMNDQNLSQGLAEAASERAKDFSFDKFSRNITALIK